MTPTPAPDEPIDPAVRSLLWRLRARLVTPPEQTRTTADLDRLFAAAREHAHGDALAPDVIRIIPPVTAGIDDVPSAPGTGVDHPFEVDRGDGTPVPAGVTPINSRRYRLTTMVSRVAAAVVLVVAVGGGLASARDGNGLIIQALLGRGASEPAEPDTLAGGSAGDVADDLDLDGADLPEPRGVPLPGDDDSTEVADDPNLGETTPQPAGSQDDATDDTDDAPASDAPEPSGEDTDGASDDVDEPADAPVEAPTDNIVAAPAPAPAPPPPAETPATPEAPTDEVPDQPSTIVGSGGPSTAPTPCLEDEGLTACLERRAAEDQQDEPEAPADEPVVEDEPADDAPRATDEDVAAKERLAKQRGS